MARAGSQGHGRPNSCRHAKVGALGLHPTLVLPHTPPHCLILSHRPTPAPCNPSPIDTAVMSHTDTMTSHRRSSDVTPAEAMASHQNMAVMPHRHSENVAHRYSTDITHTPLLPSPCRCHTPPVHTDPGAPSTPPVCTPSCPRHTALQFSRLLTPRPQYVGPREVGTGQHEPLSPPGESPGSPASPHLNPGQM